MMCYNVYMPLLLRLSNDVEENRGPSIFEIANPNNTVCADFSQGNLIKLVRMRVNSVWQCHFFLI